MAVSLLICEDSLRFWNNAPAPSNHFWFAVSFLASVYGRFRVHFHRLLIPLLRFRVIRGHDPGETNNKSSSTKPRAKLRRHLSMPGLVATVRKELDAITVPIETRRFSPTDCPGRALA